MVHKNSFIPVYNKPLIYNDIIDTSLITNILLIDCNVNQSNIFFQNVNSNTFPIIYSYYSNRDDLLKLLTDKFINLSRLSIVTHDSGIKNGKKFLNNELFFTNTDLINNVSVYSENIIFIIDIIKKFNIKNFDYLACNTLLYDNWKSYYSILNKETSVIIGASNDSTGNIKYGGDWILESTNMDIEYIYFTNGIENYYETLSTLTIQSNGGTIYIKQDFINGTQYSFDNSNWTVIQLSEFPVQIENTYVSSNDLTVLLTTDIIINSSIGTNGYFILYSEHIIFNGANFTVTIDGIDNSVGGYNGLIQNGDSSNSGFSNITLENIGVLSINDTILNNFGGWVCQGYFGRSSTNNVNNCYSNGDISGFACGGILGWYTGQNGGIVTANNCYSTGSISGYYSGGIFGGAAGYINGTVNAINCYSTGVISGQHSGGIFGGALSCSNGTASVTNCYSTGDISGLESGGIIGNFNLGPQSDNGGKATITNCYSIGTISGYYSGGIAGNWFGYNSNNLCQIINCYSVGTISGSNSGGIVGAVVGFNNSTSPSYTPNILIQNCYSLGNISNGSGGICGGTKNNTYTNTPTVNLKNCYTIGTISANSGGIVSPNLQIKNSITQTLCNATLNAIWSDSIANTTLIINTNIWTDISPLNTISYLLTSYNASLYNPSFQTITSTGLYTSSPGLFIDTLILSYEYFIITVNNSFTIPTSISINLNTGILTFNNVNVGTYIINILCAVYDGSVYSNYNINNYTLTVNTGIIKGATGNRGPIGPVGTQSKCNNIYTYLKNPYYITFYNNLYIKLYNKLYNPLYNQSYNQSYNQLYVQLYNQIYDQLSKYGNTKNLGPRGPRGNQGPSGPVCKDTPIVINNPTYELLYEQLYNQMYDQLYVQLYNQLYDQLYNQLHDQLYNQLKKDDIQLTYSTNYVLGATGPKGYQGPQGPECSNCSINGIPLNIFSSYEGIYDQLYVQLYNQLYDQLYVQLYNQDYNQLYEQLYDNLFNKLL